MLEDAMVFANDGIRIRWVAANESSVTTVHVHASNSREDRLGRMTLIMMVSEAGATRLNRGWIFS
jgi:hypothetical protein